MIPSITFEELPFAIGIEDFKSNIALTPALATPERDARILYFVVSALSPRHILEIGTFYGHTAFGMAINSPNSTIYTLDICREMGIMVPGYQEIELLSKNEVGKIFKKKKLNIIQLFGDSRSKSTYINLPKFDFIYIDGNHSYDSIVSDTMNVFAKAKPGSLIFWHDYKDDGLVETKRALFYLNKKLKMPIRHIKNSWLAFTKIQ